MSRIFNIDENTVVICKTYATRSSWGHKATVMKNGIITTQAKIVYYNRTWEKYQFQSVLVKVLEKDGYSSKEAHAIGKSFN